MTDRNANYVFRICSRARRARKEAKLGHEEEYRNHLLLPRFTGWRITKLIPLGTAVDRLEEHRGGIWLLLCVD